MSKSSLEQNQRPSLPSKTELLLHAKHAKPQGNSWSLAKSARAHLHVPMLLSVSSDPSTCSGRLGSGDPALRDPGPGTPYPDPEYPPVALGSNNGNGTFAQQVGYCAGMLTTQPKSTALHNYCVRWCLMPGTWCTSVLALAMTCCLCMICPACSVGFCSTAAAKWHNAVGVALSRHLMCPQGSHVSSLNNVMPVVFPLSLAPSLNNAMPVVLPLSLAPKPPLLNPYDGAHS